MAISKADGNQREIVTSLRAVGATVQHLHTVRCGCPDLLVGYRGRNFLFEVKEGNAKLTEAEREWHTTWRGEVQVVRTPLEALRAIGLQV